MKTDTLILKHKIGANLASGDARSAKSLALRLCKKAPKDAQAWMYLASACLQLAEYAEAENASNRAIKQDATDNNAYRALVRAQIGQGKPAEACLSLKRLLALAPGMIDARGMLAEILFSQGDLAEAEQQFNIILEAKPDNRPALLGLLRVLRAGGRREEGLAVCRALLQGPHISTELATECAQILFAWGEFHAAESALKYALATAPLHPGLHSSLADLYQSQNRFREATDAYREAIKALPNVASLHVNLGRALQKRGMTDEAIACHHRALQLDPHNAPAQHNLGICLYSHDAPGDALRAFEQALMHDPSLGLAKVYAAVIRTRLHDEVNAEDFWRQVREQHPEWLSIFDSHKYMRTAAPEARTFSLVEPLLTHSMRESPDRGLVLEFGVFYGNSIGMLARATRDTVHGFDSFHGLPAAWQVDACHDVVESAGTYTMHGALPDVPDNVELHVGLFADTLPAFLEKHDGPVRLLHVDCDLYESTVTIFEHLKNRIQAGTVIVFDEYLCYPNWREDEYRAFQEFIARSKLDYEYIAYNLFTGQAVVRIR